MECAENIRQLISKARKLKDSEKFGTVFISVDGNMEQRNVQRELVAELKQRRAVEPGKRHFIRMGVVETVNGITM